MSELWSAAEAEAATLGHATQRFAATGMSIDTRTLKPGDLFVALQGDSRDGHDFAAAAIAAKAAAALVSRAPENLPTSSVLLMVANTQRGLEDLARASRARSHAKIVGVTGSAGKTTTKEMLRLALGALGETHVSAASYNNHWGVPLSLASMPRTAAFGVFEIGMNHFGEIRSLVSFVRPHVALVTTIAPAHLEFFGTCEAIADAKSEIFEGIVAGGAALIPGDSPYAERLSARAKQAGAGRVLTFGSDPKSDARLLSAETAGEGMIVEAEVLGRRLDFRLGAPGAHLASNAVSALLTVAALDGDVLNAAAALSAFVALRGRGDRFRVELEGGEVEVIDESYNANPASMEAALALLAASRPGREGRRIAVLGDMLEMGPAGPAYHAALASPIRKAGVDVVFACGPQMRTLWEALPGDRRGTYGEASSGIASAVRDSIRAGDVLLVKGSFGSKMSVIIDALKARAPVAV
jgi:UDP-N-acetylmuramoyl-tripeptide--D-alanyl-D-alanine ligase